jgi:predicted HTH domain antitoxin
MKRFNTTIKRGGGAMPKKIQFEWELPETLVDELTHDRTEVADTIKAAAVLDWVRTHKLSLRRGAELLQMPYRAFLELMAAHRVPSIDYEVGWLDHEQHLFEGERGAAPA